MLQSLVLTSLGGLLAIAGAIAGYLLQNHEARHARFESYNREDLFRLHQDRRQAYRDFHVAFIGARPAVNAAMDSPDDTELRAKVREARNVVLASYIPLWHVGAEEVVQAARNMMHDLHAVGWHGATSSWDDYVKLVDLYVLAVRNDLMKQDSSLEVAEASGALATTAEKINPRSDLDSDRETEYPT
jgi:hypothetical protein